MLSDIEISQKNEMKPITEIAASVNLQAADLELYGDYKAKVKYSKLKEILSSDKKGKLILVTAITPTPAGEGKSTVSVGLGDALHHIGKNVVIYPNNVISKNSVVGDNCILEENKLICRRTDSLGRCR